MKLREDLKAGDEIQIQIAPFGDYPATTIDGKEITQRFDKESFERLVQNWIDNGRKQIRCDYDHNSEMTDDTVATGWISEMHVDDDKGLMGTLVVSDSGAASLNGLDYRFGSPVFIFDETEHPVELSSFAFTNRPRLDNMDAVYNMADKVKNEDQKTEEEKPEEKPEETIDGEIVNNEGDNTESMNELITILGLPPEAVEEDIINAVKELVEKVKSITEAEIAEEAEEIVNECGIEEDKKEEVVNCYKQNPALVKSVLNALKKVPGKMVANAQEAVKPELTEDEKLKREYNALKGGKDKVDFLKKHPGLKF